MNWVQVSEDRLQELLAAEKRMHELLRLVAWRHYGSQLPNDGQLVFTSDEEGNVALTVYHADSEFIGDSNSRFVQVGSSDDTEVTGVCYWLPYTDPREASR